METYKTPSDLTGNVWENIQYNRRSSSIRPRTEAVGNFRLTTGHDRLPEHLYKLGIFPTDECHVCSASVMNSVHFLVCPDLDVDSQRQDNIYK